ncbi:reverse transcriptase domain-containing protein [Tanacetum coccineum]|uniref:Reverse transcriptase domain-containing protein n=1 Tax=Tanacetum coccineum TaxID=301880 RepID=A0ABQ4WFP1_9ASTR
MMELTLEESLSMFIAKIAKRIDENTNLFKKLQASTDFALRNHKASIKSLEIQTISTSVNTDKPSIRRIDASQYAVSNLQNRNLFSESKKTTRPSPSCLNDDYWDELKETNGKKDLEARYTNEKPLVKALPRKKKDPRSFTLPCFIKNMCYKALADLGASVSVIPYLTYTTLGLGDLIPTKLIVELADRIVKRPKGIVENVLVDNFKRWVYALSLIKSTKLDLEDRLMGNTLKNRLHDPKFEDYIELSDLNEPLELRHDQVVDLGPTIDEGEGMDEHIINDIETKFNNIGYNEGECEYLGFYNFCHP